MSKGKEVFKKVRDQLVIDQVRRAKVPVFPPDRVCRWRVRFSGRVQKVGFRLEVAELARRLELTGSCMNLPGGDVLAELQGPENRIRFLLSFMGSLKRIRIDRQEVEELPVVPEEQDFSRR